MAFEFKKATKEKLKARIALLGPAGSGKTKSALKIAVCFGRRIAVIDSEHGSARKYAHEFDFDVLELDTFSPDTYTEAIGAAEQAGYDVIVVDGLSQAWAGKDGALEQVDRVKRRGGNGFTAWGDVTPKHTRLIEAMLACTAHLIVTMRVKTEYVQEKDEKGKTTVRKIGLQPVQRDGLEYEFDVVGELNTDHLFIVSKTRCDALDGREFDRPGRNVAEPLLAWLNTGAEKAQAARPAEVLRGDTGNLIVDAVISKIRAADSPDALADLGEKITQARDACGRGSDYDKLVVAAYISRKAALEAVPPNAA